MTRWLSLTPASNVIETRHGCSPTLHVRPYRTISTRYPSRYSFCPFAPEINQMGILSIRTRDVAQRLNSQTGPGYLPDPPSSHRQPHHCHSSPARRHIRATSSYTRTATLPPLLCTTETIRPQSSPNSPQPQELNTVPSSSHTPFVSLHRIAVRRSSLQEVPAAARHPSSDQPPYPPR